MDENGNSLTALVGCWKSFNHTKKQSKASIQMRLAKFSIQTRYTYKHMYADIRKLLISKQNVLWEMDREIYETTPTEFKFPLYICLFVAIFPMIYSYVHDVAICGTVQHFFLLQTNKFVLYSERSLCFSIGKSFCI